MMWQRSVSWKITGTETKWRYHRSAAEHVYKLSAAPSFEICIVVSSVHAKSVLKQKPFLIRLIIQRTIALFLTAETDDFPVNVNRSYFEGTTTEW